MSLYTRNQSKCCPFHEPHIVVDVIVECCTSTLLSRIALFFFCCVYLYNGGILPWLPMVFGLTVVEVFRALRGYNSRALQSYDSPTLRLFESTTLQLYDHKYLDKELYGSTALQCYDSTVLRDSRSVWLYGSMALQLCDNNLYGSMALQLYNSTTLWLYASYGYMSLRL